MTCTRFHALTNERSLWISVLNTARLFTTLACSPHTDLSRSLYSLSRLKKIALHNLKLEASWARKRPTPSPGKPPLTTNFSEPPKIMSIVQGTDIMLLHFPQRREIVRWDKKAGKTFPFPPIPISGGITDVAEPFDSDGVSIVAFVTLEAASGTRHAHILKSRLEASIFVSEDMVGCVDVLPGDYATLLVSPRGVAARLSEDRSHKIKLPSPIHEQTVLRCFIYKGHLYNVFEDGVTTEIQHFSRNTIRSGRIEQCQSWTCDIPSSDCLGLLCCMLPSTPFYGVGAVFAR
ncbi:hypothetical protein C8F01DRAFT_1369005 [Mycena amicta]|nr:hypothetical protein C8F01DRAFT_1369005 [Mycena amicta]